MTGIPAAPAVFILKTEDMKRKYTMNIDKKLCARAMDKAGEEPITQEEWEEGTSTRVRLIKDVYLASILEALAGTEWTCQKVRARLVLSEKENLTSYRYAYNLPADCAKPCALTNDEVYLVEGRTLYTNTENAILVYVSNNYTGKFIFKPAEAQPTTEEELEAGDYYIYDENEDDYVRAQVYAEGIVYYVQDPQDYEGYTDFNFDPLLTEYIECLIAQKIVLKITGDMNKYQLLYNEARLMENRAVKASIAHGHNKDRGNPYWGDVLGLPNYGGN